MLEQKVILVLVTVSLVQMGVLPVIQMGVLVHLDFLREIQEIQGIQQCQEQLKKYFLLFNITEF